MKLNKHIAALCIGTFCLGVAELGIVPVLTDVAHSLHVSIPQAGLYISAYAAGVCAGIIGLLVFARSVNLKYTLLAAAVLILVGNASAALAQNDYMMLAARFISGSLTEFSSRLARWLPSGLQPKANRRVILR